jgi:hypothetical protein
VASQIFDVYTKDREILTLMDVMLANNAIRKSSVVSVSCIGEYSLRPHEVKEDPPIRLRLDSTIFV